MRNIPNELHTLLQNIQSVITDVNDELTRKYRPTVSRLSDIAEQIKNIYMFDRMAINGMEPVTDLNNEKVYLTNDLYYLTANDYQFVEYLQSDGFSYINTGIRVSNTYGFKCDFEPLNTTDSIVVGVKGGGDSRWALNTQDTIRLSWNTYTSFNTNDLARHIVSMNYLNDRKRYIDNVEKTAITNTLDSRASNYNVLIFAALWYSSTPSLYCTCKLYSLEITDGNNIIHNYKPCYRKIDNLPGLYDTVEDKFYLNNGTGTFIVGPDIT